MTSLCLLPRPILQDTFEDTFLELRKWCDTSADAAHAVLHAQREARAGRLAGALKALDKVSTRRTCLCASATLRWHLIALPGRRHAHARLLIAA